jgi:hypothetical protein
MGVQPLPAGARESSAKLKARAIATYARVALRTTSTVPRQGLSQCANLSSSSSPLWRCPVVLGPLRDAPSFVTSMRPTAGGCSKTTQTRCGGWLTGSGNGRTASARRSGSSPNRPGGCRRTPRQFPTDRPVVASGDTSGSAGSHLLAERPASEVSRCQKARVPAREWPLQSVSPGPSPCRRQTGGKTTWTPGGVRIFACSQAKGCNPLPSGSAVLTRAGPGTDRPWNSIIFGSLGAAGARWSDVGARAWEGLVLRSAAPCGLLVLLRP